VKPFSTTATIRKQIEEQQAVLTSLFHVFEDVDVEDCKFKITHVARNLLAVIHGFADTIRRKLPSHTHPLCIARSEARSRPPRGLP